MLRRTNKSFVPGKNNHAIKINLDENVLKTQSFKNWNINFIIKAREKTTRLQIEKNISSWVRHVPYYKTRQRNKRINSFASDLRLSSVSIPLSLIHLVKLSPKNSENLVQHSTKCRLKLCVAVNSYTPCSLQNRILFFVEVFNHIKLTQGKYEWIELRRWTPPVRCAWRLRGMIRFY